MKLIWHGTACIEAVCSAGRIIFDPFVPLKGSGIDVNIAEFDGFSDILVTHGHFDHIASLPQIVTRNPEVTIYCTQTPYRTLRKKGVPEKNLICIAYGDVISLNGFTIWVFHGKHAVLPKAGPERISYALRSPARLNIPKLLSMHLTCRENDETVFYRIEADEKIVDLMGSLNLRGGTAYPTGADLLILPYNGWDDDLPPAKKVIERLKPKRVVLDHYDDAFPPFTMPMDLSPVLEEYKGLVSPMELRKAVEV